ncbi:glycine betaine ABC transporter substrate-binding protein [Pararhodobacter sp. SW119]|uniref:glycine betaine ABC transporter substrate-binding protein n=1 Tax=Pararhodobacter sp. SW119 TaxID=2780075 RepID=UPI001AE0E89C|nr:glycine betaine ABC transporter substrate-binding protein [Pararhodobacter sp. SW119]
MFAHSFKTMLAGAILFAGAAQAQTIVVGGKNFTEQQILTSMTSQLLEANGFSTDNRGGMGSAVVRQAMENGQIDVYWEYTGTSLITYNGIEEQMDAEQTYNTVKELDAEKGIVWLNPSEANNTYALAMRREQAEELGISTLSEMAERINTENDLTLASNAEWYARADGFGPLQQTYGFSLGRAQVRRMDSGLVYEALRNGNVEVGLVFATDGRIPAFDFVTLEDDLGFFPAYALAPNIRAEILEAHPEIGDLLNELSARLDDETMARLNARVDVERVAIEQVAADFLAEEGLM